MSAIFAFVPKSFLFWLAVASLALTVVQKFQIDGLRTDVSRYETALEQCAQTNSSNRRAMDFFTVQNAQCLEDRRTDETRLANAVAAWNAERNLLEERANEKAATIVEVYRDPDCEALAKLNVAALCPAMVDGLLRRAESLNRIRD